MHGLARLLALTLTLALGLVGCSGSGEPTKTTPPVSNNAEDTPAARPAESGEAILERLVSSGNTAVYAADTDDAVAQAFEAMAAKIANAHEVTDAMISAEIDVRNGHVASLHSGEVRVYPDQRTMRWMLGIVEALERALELRRAATD